MKKRLYILGSIFLIAGISFGIYTFTKHEKPIPPLLKRTGPISTTSEWLNTQSAINTLTLTIERNPEDYKSKLLLALAYMQEARITGEHPYYYPAALDLVNTVISKSENKDLQYQAMVAKSTVLLSLHHFADALQVANEAIKINEYNAEIYGVMCDANVELGNYEQGVKMADKMVSIRPDIRSYSRVSYLREIYGDTPGAIEAMKLAVSAGFPGLEQTAWARITLGKLYEETGDLQNAELQYKIALQERPHYAFAIGGLGRLEAKKKNYNEAIKLFTKAGDIIPEFSFKEELAEIYKETGKETMAKSSTSELLEMLKEDEEAGHYVDLELANIYIELLKDYDKAMEHANKEFEKRPDNIDVCKTIAHIYYKKRNYAEANKYLKTATKTKKQSADLLCLNGLINLKSGDKANGLRLIKKSLEIDPYQNSDLAEEGRKLLINSLAKM